MKLSKRLVSLPIFGLLGLSILAANTALADHRHDNGRTNFRGSWDHNSSRHSNYRRDNSRFLTYANRRGNRDYRHYGNYNHYNRHDNWSVSLNYGAGFSNGWYGASWSTGPVYRPFRSAFYDPWYTPYRSRTTVVYREPTVIYVDDDDDYESTRVIRRTTARPSHPTTSLLRDINGNCWERNFDSEGNETRVQLPDSECDF